MVFQLRTDRLALAKPDIVIVRKADVDPHQRLVAPSVNTARQRSTKASAPMDPDFIYFLLTFIGVLIVFAIGLRLLVPIVLQHFKGSAGQMNNAATAGASGGLR